ncbi:MULTISPECIES: hypothetical protein [unclassified Novosphingobium]|uniref:hypothetical protein n=1 Tax=unclassified Novosphingobium TaxID=2644732 RepID=UPI001469E4CB|nr:MULTISPECIES: hypothetical protein [unclassified Novosphingobium]NMN07515.1 hypothetical protein [Novosphingobium sp. SG919]NMN89798.1 hypothetical protein [Novosphingobium sp. SG916]
MAGLVSDPARQAQDTFRGYIYQILRSIVVWLDLGDDEQLFLEGAEDLDRIEGTEALTEQVKDTAGSGNITLRTASVVDAINNFWMHRTRNPGIAIRYRYVTTSGIGVEQGSSFNNGRGGLGLWNSLRAAPYDAANDAHIASIARFLLDEDKLSSPLKLLFNQASPADLFAQVIQPIEWMAGQQDGDALVRNIKDRLVVHGAASLIAPPDAELAFDALYTAAFDAAKQKDGVPLNRAKFLRIFASATGVHVPKQDLLTLMRAALSSGGGHLAVQTQALTLEGPPPLPLQYFRRVASEQALKTGLLAGTVLLHGSTGSGKTLSAASTLVGDEPLWLMLRDLSPGEVKARLVAAAEQLRAGSVARTLVVDDLDALSDPRGIAGPLGALWHVIQAIGGRLLVTSDRTLPGRLAEAVQLDPAREFQMQPFDADEIEAFLRENGCPGDRAKLWSRLLEVSTLGHPQLVSARVRTLAAKDFPQPDHSDLLGASGDLDPIKFEARRLISELPEGARELLLRASLMTGRLSRKRLMSIGRLQDAIAEPGVAVDIIAGPWLEKSEDGEYRVSPLTRGAAEELRGQDWVKAMHGQLAWTYLLDRTVSPWDISSILMHCYIAGAASPLVYVSQGMFSASDEAWAAVGEACGIYIGLGLDASNPLPFRTAIDVFIFRILQYRIAAETNPDTAMRIALKIEEEFAAAPDDDGRQFFRFLYLSQFLSSLKVRYPIAVIVARSLEFFDVAKSLETTFPERLAKAGLEDEDSIPAGTYVQFASLRLLSQIQDIDEFIALIEALEGRSVENACTVLNSIGTPDDMASVMIERLWLTEYQSKAIGWPAFREKLRNAFDFSAEVGATSMARAIAPVLLRMINEDMGDPQGAIAEAGDLDAVVGTDPIYICAFAKVTSDAGGFLKARQLWREALPRWPRAEDNIGCAFAYRSAAIGSARNGEWTEAADYFDRARSLIEDGSRPTFTIGLMMDSALARFMGSDRGRAVREFGQVVAALAPMQADYECEPLLSLQRRCGGVLSAAAGWTVGERTDEEMTKLVGMCSNLDPFVTDAPVAPPLDTLRLDLIRLEIACGASLDRALQEASALRASPFMSLRAGSGPVLFELAQRTLDFSEIVIDGTRLLDALAMLAEQIAMNDLYVMRVDDGKARDWSEGANEILVGHVVVATFALAAADQLDRLPIARWRADAAAHPQGGRVEQLADHIEGLFITGTVEAWGTVLKCPSTDWSHHAISALAATLLERLAPDALLVAQSLWAHYLKEPHRRQLAEHYATYLASRQWAVLTKFPALFGSSESGTQSLATAIAAPGQGWSKLRTILQAALAIVPLAADDNARKTIEAMEA